MYNNGNPFVCYSGTITFVNSTFLNNSNSAYLGGGTQLTYINSIVRDENISNDDTNITINVYNSNFISGDSTFNIASIDDFTWGTGNTTANPSFVDSANANYHLSDASPLIGAGIASIAIGNVTYTAPSSDLDGNLRPNPAGPNPDMGAFESE